MRHIFIGLIILILGTAQTKAETNTLITGVMENTGEIKYSPKKMIKMEIYTPHLNNAVKYHKVGIKNDRFEFKINLVEPQIVTLKYLRRKVYLFLQPNDTLHIEADADDFFPSTMNYYGKAAINNNIYRDFSQQFPEDRNTFRVMQYRKGTVYYKVGRDLDSDMRRKNHTLFEEQLTSNKDAKMLKYAELKNKYGKPSELFDQYMWAESSYGWAYFMLTYGHCFGFSHKAPPEFMFFHHKVPLQNDLSMGNEKYRNYLVAYINYEAMQMTENEDSLYLIQYELAKEKLKGRPQAYVISNLLVRGFGKRKLKLLLPQYQEFLKDNEHTEFNQVVIDKYQAVNRYSPGQRAPDFSLADTSGVSISLSDFRGKIVYVDFWASWCRPCLEKMRKMKQVKKDLRDPNMIFIHVTFDKNVEEWKAEITKNGFNGIHLQAPEGVKSLVAQNYNIKALPEYFIINSNGSFAAKPMRFDLTKVQETLKRLLPSSSDVAQDRGALNQKYSDQN